MHFILIRKMPHLKEIFVVDISDKKNHFTIKTWNNLKSKWLKNKLVLFDFSFF